MSWRVVSLWLGLTARMLAQNVVEDSLTPETLPAARVDPERIEEVLGKAVPRSVETPKTPHALRVQAKLVQHVERLVKGWPWRPFHCTLGISGSETYFDHPDELFYALSIALPYLPAQLQSDVKSLLRRVLAQTPPYGLDGFDGREGQPRERYDVPENLRRTVRGRARSLFGIAAFGAYLYFGEEMSSFWEVPNDPFPAHWEQLKERVRPYLAENYDAELKNLSAPENADVLNGNLAGLIDFARFAKARSEDELYRKAVHRVTQLAQIRVDLERTDPRLLVPSASATKKLHHVKLARFCNLSPDILELLREEESVLAASRLKAFRQPRPGWWMAFGDRYIGGENYISPPHMAHALFVATAFLEKPRGSVLADWIDVPWCEADLYFIEKCVLALRAPQ